MGNYLTCALSSPAAGPAAGPKVVLPSGEISRPGLACSTAAELMLEHPGYFLARSTAILTSRRLLPLPADEELDPGAVYALFPMGRVGSPAAPPDLARLLPRRLPQPSLPGSPLPPLDHGLAPGFRYNRCRSGRPVLETITEETVHSLY